MARPETLVPGNCYFLLVYTDEKLLIPSIDTLVYVRCEDTEDRRYWIFRNPRWEEEIDAPEDENAAPSVVHYGRLTDDQLYQVLDFEGLQRELAAIAADHPLHPIPPPTAEELAPNTDFGELSQRITGFMSDPESRSMTVTIQFTDQGFYLRRLQDRPESKDSSPEGGFEMSFQMRTRRDLEKAAKIKSLFASEGLAPQVDHVFNHGRSRVLAFPVRNDTKNTERLCIRVLRDLYDMRARDRLRFQPRSRSE